mmetsp:Transcript_100179/g.309073  ORF Transcript_100179/g.309073 Transcript_100179/m.309073 type:complete len:293 (+) Transcript_100179:559-1437(+)
MPSSTSPVSAGSPKICTVMRPPSRPLPRSGNPGCTAAAGGAEAASLLLLRGVRPGWTGATAGGPKTSLPPPHGARLCWIAAVDGGAEAATPGDGGSAPMGARPLGPKTGGVAADEAVRVGLEGGGGARAEGGRLAAVRLGLAGGVLIEGGRLRGGGGACLRASSSRCPACRIFSSSSSDSFRSASACDRTSCRIFSMRAQAPGPWLARERRSCTCRAFLRFIRMGDWILRPCIIFLKITLMWSVGSMCQALVKSSTVSKEGLFSSQVSLIRVMAMQRSTATPRSAVLLQMRT